MEITKTEAIAANGKYIHRVGDSAYFTRCTLLKGETAESFEEVDTIPEEPTEPTIDYSHEVQSLVHERYSIDDEIALLRQKDRKPDEFKAYNEYCEQCKIKAKQTLNI